MLSIFRRGIFAKLMLGVLGIGLFAIVITGFGTGGSGGLSGLGGAGGSVLNIGGEKVPATALRARIDDGLARARQDQPELDIANFLRLGALEGVIQQIISSTALKVFGQDNGVAVSTRMVDMVIANIPQFQNLAGQFDNTAFQRMLAAQNRTEADLRGDIEEFLFTRQLLEPVQVEGRVPQGVAYQYASLLLETRSGMLGLVPTQAMGAGRAPTEAEIAAFYTQNRTRYIVPERRVLRYAMFGPEQVAGAAKPTEADVRAAYTANAASYGASSKRNLTQVIVADEAAARAIAAKAGAGTSLAQAASQAGLSAATLAGQTKEVYQASTNAPVANAAFAAAKGALAGPVKGGLGWYVVRVDDIVTTAARPFEAARGEIEATLAKQKAQDALAGLGTRIEEALEDGSSFDDIVREQKLAVRETAPITAAGAAPGVQGWAAPPELAPLLRSGFELASDDDPVVETIEEGQRFALLTVGNVTPAAAPPLAQIKERVKADLVVKRAADRARAVATSIVAKINAGTPPARAFAEAEMRLPPLQPVSARRLDIAGPGRQVPPPLAMMFRLPQGKARLLAAPNGQGWFVVHVGSVTPGDATKDPQLIRTTSTEFSRALGNEYAEQFARAVQTGMKIERNDDAIAKLRNELTGSVAGQ